MLFRRKMRRFGLGRLVKGQVVAVSSKSMRPEKLTIMAVFIVLVTWFVLTQRSILVCWSVQIEKSLKLILSEEKILSRFGIPMCCRVRQHWRWVLTLVICLLLFCAACRLLKVSFCSELVVQVVKMGMH